MWHFGRNHLAVTALHPSFKPPRGRRLTCHTNHYWPFKCEMWWVIIQLKVLRAESHASVVPEPFQSTKFGPTAQGSELHFDSNSHCPNIWRSSQKCRVARSGMADCWKSLKKTFARLQLSSNGVLTYWLQYSKCYSKCSSAAPASELSVVKTRKVQGLAQVGVDRKCNRFALEPLAKPYTLIHCAHVTHKPRPRLLKPYTRKSHRNNSWMWGWPPKMDENNTCSSPEYYSV